MERGTLLKLYNRFTALVEKLPGGLQKPILKELVPIRETFLESRPPRLLLLGDAQPPLRALFQQWGISRAASPGPMDNGWRRWDFAGNENLDIVDARGSFSLPEHALRRKVPDLILWVEADGTIQPEELARASSLAKECPAAVPLVAWAASENDLPKAAACLAAEAALAARERGVFASAEDFAERACALLPNSAKLAFARLTGARRAQAAIAKSLLTSFTAVCGVIGMQPIPLADLPILTSIQTLMVALIIQTTGRRLTPGLVAEFLGALGLNIGAGLLFREGARALIKIFPLWGHAVSGLVAGAGTYAIGRAAIAYFIEGLPAQETRRLFEKLKPGRGTFEKPLAHGPSPPPLPGPGD